jgi:hypothetical protein
MTLSTVRTSLPSSAVTHASLKIVELIGAHRPDLELIIWASVAAQTNQEVNELAALITPEDADLLESVTKSVFWNFGLHLCDWEGGLPS